VLGERLSTAATAEDTLQPLLTRTAPVATLSSLIALSFARSASGSPRTPPLDDASRQSSSDGNTSSITSKRSPSDGRRRRHRPRGVTQRSADVDEIELVVTVSSVKAVTMPLSASLTTVASSVTAPISSSSAAVSSQSALTDRSSWERDSSAVSSPSVSSDGVGRAVVVLAVALCPVRNGGVSVCASDTVWKELFELVAVFLGTAVDGGRRRHRDEAVAVIGSVSMV